MEVRDSAIWQTLFQSFIAGQDGVPEASSASLPAAGVQAEKEGPVPEASAAAVEPAAAGVKVKNEGLVPEASAAAGVQAKMEGECRTPPRKRKPFKMYIDLSSPVADKAPCPKRIGACQPASGMKRAQPEPPALQAPPPKKSGQSSSDPAPMVASPVKSEEKVEDMVKSEAQCLPGGQRKWRRSCKKRVKSEAEVHTIFIKKHLSELGGGYPLWQQIHRRQLGHTWTVARSR